MKVKWSFENGATKLELRPENTREKAIINLFMSEQGSVESFITMDVNGNLTIEPKEIKP